MTTTKENFEEYFQKDIQHYLDQLENQIIYSTSQHTLFKLYAMYGRIKVDAELDKRLGSTKPK